MKPGQIEVTTTKIVDTDRLAIEAVLDKGRAAYDGDIMVKIVGDIERYSVQHRRIDGSWWEIDSADRADWFGRIPEHVGLAILTVASAQSDHGGEEQDPLALILAKAALDQALFDAQT